MNRNARCLLLLAFSIPALAACDAQDRNAPAAGGEEIDRIIAREAKGARQPDERRGIEIRRTGFEPIFAGTAMQYSATFKEGDRIDLGLNAHRLAGQTMLKVDARLEYLPMRTGALDIGSGGGGDAPTVTVAGVPGYENVSLRMQQGSVDIIALDHELDAFTGVPVIKGFDVNFEGRFTAVADDAGVPVSEPADNRGVTVSGAVRYRKD